jgi:hypothetical protein
MNQKTVTRVFPIIAAGLTAAMPLRAELSPQWITRVPAGAALTAGLRGMVVDADGTSYITGIVGPSDNTDILTAAIAPDGALLWSHVYNGPEDWHDQARWIALGPGGVVYVTGNTPGPGRYANVLLLKYDAASGELLSSIRYSSGMGISEFGGTVATDAQGNVYIGGGTVGDGPDVLTLKYSADGQLQWTRVWDGPANSPYSQDVVKDLLMDASGNPVLLIHGVMNDLQPNYVVLKYAPDGNVIWETRWGGRGGDYPVDMKMDAAGDLYITGDSVGQYATIKLRGSDGALLWEAFDTRDYHNSALAVALDGRGGVYITGSIDPDIDRSNKNDNFWSIKRDAATGERLWTHFYGANCVGCYDAPADVLADSAGNVFIVGYTSSPPYSGDMILFALDASAGAEADRGVVDGGPLETVDARHLRFDADENLYVGGQYYNVNTGAVEMYVMKYASLSGIPGDLDGDGDVDQADLAILLADWGCTGGDCAGDVDGDGDTDQADLAVLLANWGR